ncbi:hypothetical protein LZD57_13750 [Jiella sp. CBK1P-4]|uniref:Uncharacterized protein n=1 Tax=Jiella avicenniae TaxID=2907202 RepID=A0A9X1P0Y8_9HYPH|nr:hypothetical protein [Jiella avicenniae]
MRHGAMMIWSETSFANRPTVIAGAPFLGQKPNIVAAVDAPARPICQSRPAGGQGNRSNLWPGWRLA